MKLRYRMLGADGAAAAELVDWQVANRTNSFGAEHEQRRIDGEVRHVFRITPAPTDVYTGIYAARGRFWLANVLAVPGKSPRGQAPLDVGGIQDPPQTVWERVEEGIRTSVIRRLGYARGVDAEDRWHAVLDALSYWRDHGVIAGVEVELGDPGGFVVTHEDGSTQRGDVDQWWTALSTRSDWPFHI
jgi:hypothetical protein